jgi:hypothetical protein
MNYRLLSHVLAALSVLLFAAAIVAYFWPEDAPGATIDDPNRESLSMAIGQNEIRFRLSNPTRHRIKVVGFSFC